MYGHCTDLLQPDKVCSARGDIRIYRSISVLGKYWKRCATMYPEADDVHQPHSGTCWDVSSTETLTHNGGSDSLGIVSAVRYAIANWGVDASRVFAAGTSSGAMMTSVLAGAYPDVFAAGVVDSGVAYGCFALPGQPEDSWNSQCSTGELIKTGAQWVRVI